MKFEYKRPEDTRLEAYGKVFDIPPKTAALIDGIMEVTDRMTAEDSTAAAQAAALRDGIALFIGESAAEQIFPRGTLITEANTDEMTAFWMTLNELSNRETEAVTARYAPKPKEEIKVPSNPKK